MASRLYEILRKDVFPDIETGPRPRTTCHVSYVRGVWWLRQTRVSWTFPRLNNIWQQWQLSQPHRRDSVGWNHLSNLTLYWACDYLSMLGLKSYRVSKRETGPRPRTTCHVSYVRGVWWLRQTRVSWTFPRPNNIWQQWQLSQPHRRDSVGWNHLSNLTLYWACDYLSMLGLKLYRVSKRGPEWKTRTKTRHAWNVCMVLGGVLYIFTLSNHKLCMALLFGFT